MRCEPDNHLFFKASIPPNSRYSIDPFLKIILGIMGCVTLNSVPNHQRRTLPSLMSDSCSMLLILRHLYLLGMDKHVLVLGLGGLLLVHLTQFA